MIISTGFTKKQGQSQNFPQKEQKIPLHTKRKPCPDRPKSRKGILFYSDGKAHIMKQPSAVPITDLPF